MCGWKYPESFNRPFQKTGMIQRDEPGPGARVRLFAECRLFSADPAIVEGGDPVDCFEDPGKILFVFIAGSPGYALDAGIGFTKEMLGLFHAQEAQVIQKGHAVKVPEALAEIASAEMDRFRNVLDAHRIGQMSAEA